MVTWGAAFLGLFLCCGSLSQIDEVALRLKFPDGTCSGTAVAKDVILTAAHCMENGVTLSFVDNTPVVAVEWINDGNDHALVKISGLQFERWAKVVGPPKQADKVRWIGNPGGEEDMYREGYVIRTTPRETFVDPSSFAGDSGSGIFDAQGRVVGVISGYKFWVTDYDTSFQVTTVFPLKFTKEQWEKMGVDFKG